MIEKAIERQEVTWQMVLELGKMRCLDPAVQPSDREFGDRYYASAYNTFCAQNPGAEVGVFSPIGGVYVQRDGELKWSFDSSQFRFDWSKAWPLVFQIEVLAEEAREWWQAKAGDQNSEDRAARERRPHSMRAYGLATWVMGSMQEENGKHPAPPPDVPPEPTSIFESKLGNYRAELTAAQERFRAAAQRTAQSRYWEGTLIGAVALLVLCAVVAGVFLWQGVSAAYGVPLLTGGLGAIVSLLQRMSSGKLLLDIDAGRDLLEVFGAVRPFIGAVFGLAVMALLLGGLVPVVSVPADQELAFFAGVGFLAGFNERWAQDMLKSSADQVGTSQAGEKEPS